MDAACHEFVSWASIEMIISHQQLLFGQPTWKTAIFKGENSLYVFYSMAFFNSYTRVFAISWSCQIYPTCVHLTFGAAPMGLLVAWDGVLGMKVPSRHISGFSGRIADFDGFWW